MFKCKLDTNFQYNCLLSAVYRSCVEEKGEGEPLWIYAHLLGLTDPLNAVAGLQVETHKCFEKKSPLQGVLYITLWFCSKDNSVMYKSRDH